MRHVAIIGSGPAGYYAAEALGKVEDVAVDVIDRLPVPYGLIRFGVAPDHQSIKAVSRRYEKVALSDNVRFVGGVSVGHAVSVDELRSLYDAVVLATGASHDRPLGLPGADLAGAIGSAAFVGWYNGHPDFADLDPPLAGPTAAVIGNGNVALDVARILAKTTHEFTGSDIAGHALDLLAAKGITRVVVCGRRGPHQIAMTPKELGELGRLTAAQPIVDPADLPPVVDDAALEPGQRKSVEHLRAFAATPRDPARPLTIEFRFWRQPLAIEGDGRVEALMLERTALDRDGRAVGTGETERLDCSLVVSAIGYRTPPIPGVPYDKRLGRFVSDDGRIADGLYAAGWARRGPSGTIGTNKPDGARVAERVAGEVSTSAREGRAGLDRLLASRGVDAVTFRDWQRIEAAEVGRARDGAPREKFTSVEAMLAALKR